MATCREIFTFSWPLQGRGGGQPKRSAWPLFHSFFYPFPNCREEDIHFVENVFDGKLQLWIDPKTSNTVDQLHPNLDICGVYNKYQTCRLRPDRENLMKRNSCSYALWAVPKSYWQPPRHLNLYDSSLNECPNHPNKRLDPPPTFFANLHFLIFDFFGTFPLFPKHQGR